MWKRGWHRWGLVAALAFAATSTVGNAEARSKNKKVTLSTGDTPSIAAYRSPALSQTTGAGAPVRFFTINQILAKLDSQRELESTPRVAFNDSISESATDALLPASFPPAGSDEPFGLLAFRAPEGLLWAKWRKVEGDMQADIQTVQECRVAPERCASSAAREFLNLIEQGKSLQPRAKVEMINRSLNATIRYVSDLSQHGMLDLWSAPLATLSSKQGDCEDYAIAKYVALKEAGIHADDLRLLLVRDRWAGDHAVLGVRLAERWIILDNRHSKLLEPENVAHFKPLFALDHQGVKLFAAPYAQALPVQHVPTPAAAHNAAASPAAASQSAAEVSLPLLL